jgi:hypothetical protein
MAATGSGSARQSEQFMLRSRDLVPLRNRSGHSGASPYQLTSHHRLQHRREVAILADLDLLQAEPHGHRAKLGGE